MQFVKPTVGRSFILAFGLLLFFACKKNETTTNENTGEETTVNANEAVNDTSWMYAQEIYLWYQYLPTSFSPSSYKDPNAVMEALRPYSTESGFSEPVDSWSFAISQSAWNDVSAGISGDIGLGIFFYGATDLRVSYVEPTSPAGAAGVQRGWQIISVNGNSTINTEDATISRIVDAVYYSASTTFIFRKSDGTNVTLTLAAATYNETPILLDTIYNIGSSKVGYMVYNSFLGDIETIKTKFSSLFSKFSSAGINELIVDLRYNSGGYVELQNELANYLVPASGNGGVMLNEKYNSKYSRYYDTTINYSKKGSLDLSSVIFITASNTASASELLINSLKPYMDVKLVGRTTYGKPVGYFGIPVGDWYIFPVSFRSLNKNGEGNYFNGISPDAMVNDGLNKNWGDIEENCLASALSYIQTGAFSNTSSRSADIIIDGKNRKLGHKFNGAVSNRIFNK